MAKENGNPVTVEEPFPIFCLGKSYLIYDINTITYIRREHHICGVLVGGLPQAPQQNVFLGVPLELMPEEVRLLVEKGAAYIIDDIDAHETILRTLSKSQRQAFTLDLQYQGIEASKSAQQRADMKKEVGLSRVKERTTRKAQKAESNRESKSEPRGLEDSAESEPSLFDSGPAPLSSTKATGLALTPLEPYAITPVVSYPPLDIQLQPRMDSIYGSLSSYAFFAHIHSKGYFISPGLRFGCQYMVYPGDPLRFHSHFLATGASWDEEIDLLDIVGGGRLGTGVKKGFLLGGARPSDDLIAHDNGDKAKGVRTFCIEWAGM
ncbi:MAG: tRNA-splicing endonuclease subunit [Vezdaea acicularis]|nr:MAG: tRNA-splicing endonuclease subunit [Vezdaea acicularis]